MRKTEYSESRISVTENYLRAEIIGMRGFCTRCKEYRSDDGMNSYCIVWKDGVAFCGKCGSVVDIWRNDEANVSDTTIDSEPQAEEYGREDEADDEEAEEDDEEE